MILEKVLFSGHLEKDEKMLFTVHKHWICIFGHLIKTIFFGVLIPFILWKYLGLNIIVFYIFGGIFGLWFLYHLIDWYFDVWIITNISVIDIEWKGLLHRLSSRIPYSEIREIGWEVKGLLPIILGYGDLFISMATRGRISMPYCKQPKKNEKRIIEIRDHAISEKKISEADTIKDLLSDLMADHVKKNIHKIKKR